MEEGREKDKKGGGRQRPNNRLERVPTVPQNHAQNDPHLGLQTLSTSTFTPMVAQLVAPTRSGWSEGAIGWSIGWVAAPAMARLGSAATAQRAAAVLAAPLDW